ncbi:MAG TPA: DUF309 domain-containing protein [Actinomycetes bacterium]|nr:DUF309 domain-containing protein [Actinomycetes bacterium]
MSEGPGPDRDRDASGRPQNARPRDGLGRPLPRGAEGVERTPEVSLPPGESLVEAQRLLDADRPFHAHEVLEGTWKAAPTDERDLWQGLAQLAVGLTHALRGNSNGAVSVLTRGRDKVASYADAPPYDINVEGLVEWANQLIGRLSVTGADAPVDDLAPPTLQTR